MKDALKLALDALESTLSDNQPYIVKCGKAITAIKAALAQPADHSEQNLDMVKAQPAQEPVAWMRPSKDGYDSAFRDHSTVVRCTGNPWAGWVPLYTTPPQQEPWCMKMNGCKTKCEDCPVEVAEPQPEERNFCQRCGKRTADLTVIHTCTPPQERT